MMFQEEKGRPNLAKTLPQNKGGNVKWMSDFCKQIFLYRQESAEANQKLKPEKVSMKIFSIEKRFTWMGGLPFDSIQSSVVPWVPEKDFFSFCPFWRGIILKGSFEGWSFRILTPWLKPIIPSNGPSVMQNCRSDWIPGCKSSRKVELNIASVTSSSVRRHERCFPVGICAEKQHFRKNGRKILNAWVWKLSQNFCMWFSEWRIRWNDVEDEREPLVHFSKLDSIEFARLAIPMNTQNARPFRHMR